MSRKKHQPGCPCCQADCFCPGAPDTLACHLTYRNATGGTSVFGFPFVKGLVSAAGGDLGTSFVPCLGSFSYCYHNGGGTFLHIPNYPNPDHGSDCCPSGAVVSTPTVPAHRFFLYCDPETHTLNLVHLFQCLNSQPCWHRSGFIASITSWDCSPLLFTFPGPFAQLPGPYADPYTGLGCPWYDDPNIPDLAAVVFIP